MGKKSKVNKTHDQSWNEGNETYSDLDADIFSTSINLSSIDKPGQNRKVTVGRNPKRDKTPSYKFPKGHNTSKHSKRNKDDSNFSGEPKGKSGDMLVGGFSETFDDELICAIHHKDLDMICQEPECETPICSSCILFGEHKNHQYIEKDKFFKHVEAKRKGLVRILNEIESAEIKLNKTNQMEEVFEKIREKRQKMEKELEFNCSKAIRQIENRKIELEKTTKVYFEGLEEKMQDYLKQTLECIDLNQNWKRQCNELLRHLTEESEDIENCFEFVKKMETTGLADVGRRTLDAVAHIEEIIGAKVEESVRSFDFRIKTFDESFIQVLKQDVSFEKNLQAKMKEVLNGNKAQNFGMSRHEDFYNNTFEVEGVPNEVPGDTEYRVSDLMSDNFNPEGSNLMLGLNNQDSQFMHSQEPFEDQGGLQVNQNNSQFMKSGGVYRNYVSNQNNNFPARHVDFTNKTPMNTSGYGKKQFQNMQKSQYNQRMMNKTRSTKQLLRSKNQSSSHAQTDIGKAETKLIDSHEQLQHHEPEENGH